MLKDRNNAQENLFPIKIFLLVCAIGVTISILIEYVNMFRRNPDNNKKSCLNRPGYWIHDLKGNENALKHVQYVLKKVGYEEKTSRAQCDLLWFSKTPFKASQNPKFKLAPQQIVNHFPGMHFITNELSFATTVSKYIPKTLILPEDKDVFVNYALPITESLFLVKKLNQGKVLKKRFQIDLVDTNGQSIVQEYIQKPFLVDGFKVDIGVFVVITSVNPLRAYWYKGDMLFRFSKDKYSMEDNTMKNQDNISKDYLYTWDMPSLRPYYNLNNGMKNAFDVFVYTTGKESLPMWEKVQQAITEILHMKEHHIVEAIKSYGSNGNFFEILRFDLIVNNDLDVYLLGANTLDSMSANTDLMHQDDIALFYQQLLYNVFALTGISRGMIFRRNYSQSDKTDAEEMVSSTKQIVVFGEECRDYCRDNCEYLLVCKLCRLCMDSELRNKLLKANAEYMHRGEFRRLVPPPMLERLTGKDNGITISDLEEIIPKNLSLMNRLQYLWYQGKCNQDITWCA